MKKILISLPGKRFIYLPKLLITMKLITGLFMLNLFTLSGTGFSQTEKVTLKLENASLKELVNSVERQTEYKFLYRNDEVEGLLVNLDIENTPLDQVLNSCLEDTDLDYKILANNLIVIALNKILQQQSVTGKITDAATGEAMAGVNITVKGTTIGTMSGTNGTYNLTVTDRNATLVFSFIGYTTQEIPLSGRTTLNVALESEVTGLEEVVVVGYGTQKRINLTGSVASIDSRKLEKVPPTGSTVNTLAGRMPGLISRQQSGRPGFDAASISVRGFGNALIIVDGAESEFNNIDVNEIESISILKDASAAIYGARAGNGVILITTKRGKDGKPSITLNSSYSLQNITNYPKMMNSGQWAEFDREKRAQLGQQQRYTQADVDLFYAGTDPDYPNTDWFDVLIKPNAPMQQHNLSISGGSDKIRYYGLIGYMDQQTFWKKNGGYFQRYNIRSNIDAKITDNLSLQIDFSNINEIRRFPARGEGAWHDFWCSYPIYPSSLPDPTKLVYAGVGGLGGAINSSNREILGFSDNDIQSIKAGGSLKYDIPFIKGLSAKYYLNYFQSYTNDKLMWKPGYFYTYSYKNDAYTLKGTWNPEASIAHTDRRNRIITNQLSLNYDKIIADIHTISALLLYEFIDYSNDYIQAQRYHFLTPAIEYLFGGSTRDQYAFGSASEMGRKSFIGRLNYSFKSKYLFEATLRADASAKFAPEERWGYFPSLSVGWRISEESFLRIILVG